MNLKELSNTLGLSQTTVSRALNGYPEVSEATRIKVREAARRYNYRPNTRARGLATGRAMAIGHVMPFSKKHEMVNPVFGDFLAGAGELYAERGYDILMTLVQDEAQEQVYRKMKAEGSVDGIVLHGPKSLDARIAKLTEIGLPFMVHGRATDIDAPYSWVDVNNARAFRRAAEFLIDLGHRRIALINGLEDLDFALRRRRGYLSALEAAGIAADEALMQSAEMTEVYGFTAARDMLTGANAPTAFLVSSMITAIGVRRAIQDAGLTMGQDVSVITFDDDLGYLTNGQDVPIFTATRSSVRQAGRQLAAMLIDLIEDPTNTPRTHLMEAELIIGRSTGPAPTS